MSFAIGARFCISVPGIFSRASKVLELIPGSTLKERRRAYDQYTRLFLLDLSANPTSIQRQ